jgi:hypothetical protein
VLLGLLARDRQALLDLLGDLPAYDLGLLGRQLDGAVVVLDGLLDGSDGQVAGAAAGTPRLMAEAAEVLIDPAVASVASVDQPSTTVPAEDRALEVMKVLLGAVSGEAVGVEDLLDLLEGRPVDDCWVTPLTRDALVRHDPDVVVVAQDAIDAVAAQWLGWPLGCRTGTQSQLLEQVAQRRDRVIPGGESIERDLNQPVAILIQGDRADLAAPIGLLAHVQVAGPRRAERPAVGELALQPHLDLLAIPARTEGVDPRHDCEQQEPLRAVIDALQRGLQLGA